MTSAGTRNATRMSGVSCVWASTQYRLISTEVPSRLRLYRHCGSEDYLRGGVGVCSIEIAYQAAEANHPDRGRAGSPLTKDTSQPEPAEQAETAKNPIGQASPQETLAESHRSVNRRVLLQVDRAEGLSVLNRCLALDSHRRISGRSRQGSSRRVMVDGVNENAAMRRARKVHPLLARRGYASVVVDCVREYYSPTNCATSTTGGNLPAEEPRVSAGRAAGNSGIQQPQRWKS